MYMQIIVITDSTFIDHFHSSYISSATCDIPCRFGTCVKNPGQATICQCFDGYEGSDCSIGKWNRIVHLCINLYIHYQILGTTFFTFKYIRETIITNTNFEGKKRLPLFLLSMHVGFFVCVFVCLFVCDCSIDFNVKHKRLTF